MLKNFFSGAATSDAGAVAHEEFAQAVDGGHVLVVDVREPREFAAGRIPGAVNMPMSRFDPQELPSGRPVVLICQAPFAQRLESGARGRTRRRPTLPRRHERLARVRREH